MHKRRTDTKRPRMGSRLKLEVQNMDPAYEYRWFNDDGNRIREALESGREYVLKDDVVLDTSVEGPGLGSCVSQCVGKHPDGSPKTAYLLRIRKEWYDEDQIEKQKACDLIDQSIRTGSLAPVPNAYTPGHDRIVGDVVKRN
jgi:hypothetical protein